MNFFKGVKQKLSNVTDDISKSIRTPRKTDKTKQIKIDDCSFLGGAQLLEKYQNDWSSVHDGNEGIAKTAWRVDQTIGILHKFVAERHAQYSRVAELMSNDLPRLENDLEEICSALSAVHEAIERTEISLAGLEDQIEWCELRKNEDIATKAWFNARRQSTGQMEAARVTRAKEHAQRVANAEQKLQSAQRERSATFEEEFQRDVQHFREHGRIDRAVSHASATEADLAAIQVSDDTDAAALDDFLNEPVINKDELESNVKENLTESIGEPVIDRAEGVNEPSQTEVPDLEKEKENVIDVVHREE